MDAQECSKIFSDSTLKELFPPTKADQFFEALFGDASEGSYDIALKYSKYNAAESKIIFELQLTERPGKCLACNLTYGLPDVFSRHPLINIKGLAEQIITLIKADQSTSTWQLESTQSISSSLHVIPLAINIGR